MSTDYITVSDDGDGEVLVADRDGGIARYPYGPGHPTRAFAREAAERRAAREAKARGCDWGTNY